MLELCRRMPVEVCYELWVSGEFTPLDFLTIEICIAITWGCMMLSMVKFILSFIFILIVLNKILFEYKF